MSNSYNKPGVLHRVIKERSYINIGDFISESHSATLDIGIVLTRLNQEDLVSFGVLYSLISHCDDGSEFEFKAEDRCIIRHGDKNFNTDGLYNLIEQAANDCYRILMSIASVNRHKIPPRPTLKEDALKQAIRAEIHEVGLSEKGYNPRNN